MGFCRPPWVQRFLTASFGGKRKAGKRDRSCDGKLRTETVGRAMLRHALVSSVTTREGLSTESENAFAAVRWGYPVRHESWEERRSYDLCFSAGPDAGRLSKRSVANAEARYNAARWSYIASVGFSRVPSNGMGDTEIAFEFRGASRSRSRRTRSCPILTGLITDPSQKQGLDAFSFGQAEIVC